MLKHMRTTILLPDHLFAEAKRYAAQQRRTLTSVIEESLRKTLARGAGPAGGKLAAKSPTFPTFKGGGPKPGVNLDKSAALADLLDDLD